MRQIWKLFVIFCGTLFFVFSTLGEAEEALSLSQTVARALIHNSEINMAYAQERAAGHRVRVAKAGYYPNVTLSAARGYESTETEVVKKNKLSRQENRLQVSQSVFDGFSTKNKVLTQSYLLNASRYKTVSTKEEVALQAIESLLDIYLNQQFLTLSEENVKNHVLMLKKTKDLLTAGIAHQGDLKLIAARLALAQATYARYVNEISNAKARYEAVVGERFQGVIGAPIVPDQWVPGSLETALTIAKIRNPLLLSSKSSLESSMSAKTEARSGFYPNLFFEYSASNNSNLNGSLGESSNHSGMLKVTYNIFNGGATFSALKEAEEREIENKFSVEKTERGIVQQVTTDWDLWQISNARLSLLRNHLEASHVVLKTYQQEFLIGKRQMFNILDQQNEFFQSKISYQQGEVDLVRSAYRLLGSIGQLIEMVVPEIK